MSLIKKFDLPKGWAPPTKLTFEDLVARPLKRTDLKDDLEGVNSSIEIIKKTRGGMWPEGKLSEDFDLLDLAWHEREFRDKTAFAYVVYDNDNLYIGCFYLYPIGVRTPLVDSTLNFDVDASWWVTTEAYKNGYYSKLYSALKLWINTDFAFDRVLYSNHDIPKGE